ncbi:MAG: hypothetical protein IJF78_11990 [Clostridia bacterium]|nr:hypothetical protein [Clostridia bacterium]
MVGSSLFDEGGSSYNIGRDAVRSYYSAFDGSGEPTSLVRRIEETAGCAGLELLKMLYDGGKKLIASYAPLVFEEADKGDAIAQRILRGRINDDYNRKNCLVPFHIRIGIGNFL